MKRDDMKEWEQGKKPSMKRRSEKNDYTDRSIYMVTLAIEGRRPLLGSLAGCADVTEGPQAPHVVLSPLGQQIVECWQAISQHHPQIETMKLCIMPDHIHGILFVHERMEHHLGFVINGFKAGTRKAARELGIIAEAKEQPSIAEAMPLPTKRSQQKATPASPASVPCTEDNTSVSYAEAMPQSIPQPSRAKHAPIGTLWKPGYNDRLLLHKGQLARMLAYLDDNPRRLLLKRQHPEFFTQISNINVGGIPMDAMGNTTLLYNRKKRDLQVSTHLYQQEIDALQAEFLHDASEGKTIISACISRGERQIATACIETKMPFVVLLVGGFPPLYKPQPAYLQACAEGRLLLMSPFKWQNEKITNMRQRCLYLNKLAKWLSENPDIEITRT